VDGAGSAAKRPHALIIAATARAETARNLALWRGVVPSVCSLEGDIETVITRIVDEAQRSIALPSDAILVFVNTTGDLDRSGTNFLRLRRV
jgi:pyruvate kinase